MVDKCYHLQISMENGASPLVLKWIKLWHFVTLGFLVQNKLKWCINEINLWMMCFDWYIFYSSFILCIWCAFDQWFFWIYTIYWIDSWSWYSQIFPRDRTTKNWRWYIFHNQRKYIYDITAYIGLNGVALVKIYFLASLKLKLDYGQLLLQTKSYIWLIGILLFTRDDIFYSVQILS